MDTSRNQVVLKMIPRIDYTRKRGQKRGEGDRGVKRRRRPPAKLFDPDLIRYVMDFGGDFGICFLSQPVVFDKKKTISKWQQLHKNNGDDWVTSPY